VILYIDTSTLLRAFLSDSTQHNEARQLVFASGVQWVSSSLLRLETRRTAWRRVNESSADAELLTVTDAFIVKYVSLLKITDDIIASAFSLSQTIKSADAIHLASAMRLIAEIDGVVTSDASMHRVGNELGLPMRTIPEALVH